MLDLSAAARDQSLQNLADLIGQTASLAEALQLRTVADDLRKARAQMPGRSEAGPVTFLP